jgi:hypothetical protein
MGWYAVTALDDTIGHAVLDEERSYATLSRAATSWWSTR